MSSSSTKLPLIPPLARVRAERRQRRLLTTRPPVRRTVAPTSKSAKHQVVHLRKLLYLALQPNPFAPHLSRLRTIAFHHHGRQIPVAGRDRRW